jgi:hypothetical protein
LSRRRDVAERPELVRAGDALELAGLGFAAPLLAP